MNLVRIENNIVTEVLANGTVEWAENRFGGTWMVVNYPVGIGWVYDGNEISPPINDEEQP